MKNNYKIDAVIFDLAGTVIDFGSMATIQSMKKIFADKKIILETVFKNLENFKTFNFNFLLLDTFSKKSGDLFKSCSLNYLSNVLIRTKKLGLSLGLAGKLKKNQIPKLLKLQPKIIGFRSAVCKKNNRN